MRRNAKPKRRALWLDAFPEQRLKANRRHTAEQLRQYRKIQREIKGKPCYCCRNRKTEPHHMHGRTGHFLCARHFIIPLCRRCHRWVHGNPKKAKELGLLY